MVTSRKYITMNIRRPGSCGENNSINTNIAGSNTSAISPKKILSMHMNNHHHLHQQYHQQQARTTYLPLKRSINTTRKPAFTTSNSYSASLSSSSTNTNHAHNNNNHDTNNKPNSTSQSLVSERERDYNNNYHHQNHHHSNKTSNDDSTTTNKKIELINIPGKRLVNPTVNKSEASTTTTSTTPAAVSTTTTQRLRQSFFMNEFPSTPLKTSASNSNSKIEATKVTNIPSSANNSNMKSSTLIDRYEQEASDKELQASNAPNPKSSFEYCTSNSSASSATSNNSYNASKYTASSSSTLPSKHSLSRSSLTAKSKSGVKSIEKVDNTTQNIIPKPTKISQLSKSQVHESNLTGSEKDKSSATINNNSRSSSKSTSYKALVLNKTKKSSNANESTNVFNQSVNNGTNNGNLSLNNEATKSIKSQIETSSCAPARANQSECNESVENGNKFESNSGLVDQMASFIDELKDFIDDRLIDTTSQLEMANQRITGLYYNLNYLTKEFIELKNQNETLKKELQQNNTENSYYHKLNQSRRKNRSSGNSKKSDKSCDIVNSSSKTSSIETASSSTSESLTMSQSALGCSSQENHNQEAKQQNEIHHQEETVRHLNRNEMILILKNKQMNDLNKQMIGAAGASSSSSVNSVNFYDNIPHGNKIDLTSWHDTDAAVLEEDQNQYLRTSSQIELNNIVEGKYTSIEFVHDGDAENYVDEDEEGEEEQSEVNEDIEMPQLTNRSQLQSEIDTKFMMLKEADLKNSLKQAQHLGQEGKLMHAPIFPYTNFRDFDAQYSWDYTDNLVNKFTAKASHLKS